MADLITGISVQGIMRWAGTATVGAMKAGEKAMVEAMAEGNGNWYN